MTRYEKNFRETYINLKGKLCGTYWKPSENFSNRFYDALIYTRLPASVWH